MLSDRELQALVANLTRPERERTLAATILQHRLEGVPPPMKPEFKLKPWLALAVILAVLALAYIVFGRPA